MSWSILDPIDWKGSSERDVEMGLKKERRNLNQYYFRQIENEIEREYCFQLIKDETGNELMKKFNTESNLPKEIL